MKFMGKFGVKLAAAGAVLALMSCGAPTPLSDQALDAIIPEYSDGMYCVQYGRVSNSEAMAAYLKHLGNKVDYSGSAARSRERAALLDKLHPRTLESRIAPTNCRMIEMRAIQFVQGERQKAAEKARSDADFARMQANMPRTAYCTNVGFVTQCQTY